MSFAADPAYLPLDSAQIRSSSEGLKLRHASRQPSVGNDPAIDFAEATRNSSQPSSLFDDEPGLELAARNVSDSDDLIEDGAIDSDDSPFEMVRMATSNRDDPSIPTLTLRFWILGTVFTILLSFVNQFFWFRTTPLSIGSTIVMLLTLPLGKAMARYLPRDRYIRVFFWRLNLNPGPFNIKEHVLICVCAGAAAGTAYAIDVVTVKRVFYRNDDLGILGSFLLVVTTQCLGYGLAGMARSILVRRSAMIWPAALVTVVLFRTLHERDDRELSATNSTARKDGRAYHSLESDPLGINAPTGFWSSMSRTRFFILASAASCLYYFLPGYLFTSLGCVSTLCYLAPKSRLATLAGSGTRGLGLLSFSLDWNTIVAYLGSPLVTPLWAEANIFVGFVLVAWIILPLGYSASVWDAKTFPMMSSRLFQTNGSHYDPIKLLNPQTQAFDPVAYQALGPLRMSFMFAIAYGVGFASIAAVISHTILYHGAEIVQRYKDAHGKPGVRTADDIHARLMDRYPDVPDSWYLWTLVFNTALAIFVCEHYEIHLPWWGVLLAVSLAALFILPVGIITAVTNQTPGLNIITEFIIGYILPGQPIANVTFKTYGYIAMAQGIGLVADLKLGHYIHINPRHMFIAQMYGTVLASAFNVMTAYLMFRLVPNLCLESTGQWSCSNANVFFSASVIWGVIGPQKMFGFDALYHPLLWCFVIGAVSPIPIWLVVRRFPDSWLQYVHMPLLLGAVASMPPAKPVMYPSWFFIGWAFQSWIGKRHTEWWKKYGYVLSGGLDAGVVVAGLIIFVLFQYPKVTLDWWGNSIDCPAFPDL